MIDREKLIELVEKSCMLAEEECYEHNGECNVCQLFDESHGCKFVAIADYLIANGVTVQKWIPVSEMLPNRREDVLVTDGESLCTAWLSRGNAWIRSDTSAILDGFTHWMQMPQPPKGE